MKKKLLEKDIFYLSLFICVCLVAFGGILFTNKNMKELASTNDLNNKDDEINLVKDDDAVATSTGSNQNLEQAKEKQNKKSKMNYVGEKVLREYSENTPSYSKTLDVWEIHKGLDISAKEGAEIKSILDGEVISVYSDDRYGTSIEVSYDNGLRVIYSGISENTPVKKGNKVKEGDVIGYVANTTTVENKDGIHVHIEAYKDDKAINPLSLLE